jgi:hypothetical protein
VHRRNFHSGKPPRQFVPVDLVENVRVRLAFVRFLAVQAVSQRSDQFRVRYSFEERKLSRVLPFLRWEVLPLRGRGVAPGGSPPPEAVQALPFFLYMISTRETFLPQKSRGVRLRRVLSWAI